MKFYCNLYLGETIEKKRNRLIRRLEKGKILLGIYVIVLPLGENNQLEIFDSGMLMQKHFHREERFVVGIASGFDEALDLTVRITEEVYRKTGGAGLKEYILNEEQRKNL